MQLKYATRRVFALTIQSNGSFHTFAARPILVVSTKSCCNKKRSGSDFCRVSQRKYTENLLQGSISKEMSPGPLTYDEIRSFVTTNKNWHILLRDSLKQMKETLGRTILDRTSNLLPLKMMLSSENNLAE